MKRIQLRNVPHDLHRTLKARANQAGMSLSDYLLAELRRIDERPVLNKRHLRDGLRPAIETFRETPRPPIDAPLRRGE